MFEMTITPEFLSVLLAGLVAVLFDWWPGLSGWFGKLSELKKRQVMAVMLAVIVAGIYGLGCAGVLAKMACDQAQLVTLVQIYLIAIGVNQGTHLLTKPTQGQG